MTEFGPTPPSIDLNQILVIIPVLDEAATLSGVLQSLQSQGLNQIRVVDNGSRDNSVAIAQSYGAEVIDEPQRGYGQACWTGLQNLPQSIQWILFCDGDGSDDLSQLPRFWAAAETHDFVLANRRASAASRQKLTPPQNLGNGLAVQLIQWGWGHRYQDLGPLRLIRRDALESLKMQDRAFGWTVEMQVKAVEAGLSICEIPLMAGDRQGGQSKISGTVSGVIKAGVGILSTLARLYRSRYQGASSALSLVAVILLTLGAAVMQPHGAFESPASFRLFALGCGLMLGGFVLSGLMGAIAPLWFWLGTLLPRLILLPMTPGDDVWRYLWEGYLPSQGFSPYALPPNAPELEPLRTSWWDLMNYHDTSAIYPPVAQVGFQLIAHVSLTVLAFKVGFVLADLAVCWLLSRRFGAANALIYAWNPLVIYCFAGGAHYDSWLILPLVVAWFWADQRRWFHSVFWLGMSIGMKWVSLPLLTFALWRTRWRKALVVLAIALVPLLVTVPYFCHLGSCNLIPVRSSFVVQARSAEMIPYVIEKIWPASRQLNWIFAVPLVAALPVVLRRCHSFGSFAETYFSLLLLLSPVVHAWYFTWLIPFCVASRNWGTKLLSLSGFIYFMLPYRQFAGLETERWMLTMPERLLLWLPFLCGSAFTLLQARTSQTVDPALPTYSQSSHP